jgi:gluconolactonase
MTSFEILDPRFGRFVMGNAPVKQLATGFDWVEGPVWFGDAGCLLFSDIPNNRIMRWHQHLSAAVKFLEWTHAGQAGAIDLL